MLRQEIVSRALAVGAYSSVVGAITLLAYPHVRVELQVLLAASIAVVALVGRNYPGVMPTFSSLYVALYLYASYSSKGVRYMLPYADTAMISLLLLLMIPAYLFLTRIQRLDDAMTACYHVLAYVLAVAWPRSLLTSVTLLTGLSTLSSGAVAVPSVASYLILLTLTTYACQFSAVGLEELRAVPSEFLAANKELLGYEVVLTSGVALLAYLLGLMLIGLVDSRFPVPARGTLRGAARQLARRVAVAVPLSMAVAYVFDPKGSGLPLVSVSTVTFVGTLSLADSLQESVQMAYGYMLESRELAEVLELKVGAMEEVMRHFGEGELASLARIREAVAKSREAIVEHARVFSSLIPSYARAAEAYETLSRLNSLIDRELESLVEELRELAKESHITGRLVSSRPLSMAYEELEMAQSKAEKWKVLRSLVPKLAEVLRQTCAALEQTLLVEVPNAYYELFGFRPTLRMVESCSSLGVRAIRTLREDLAALLLGLERRIDATVEALGRLAEEADRLSRLTGAHEARNPYVHELIDAYQSYFSHAHTLTASDVLDKLHWLVDVRRSALPKISEILEKAISLRLEIEELDRALSSSLKPVGEALEYIKDPETPLADLLPFLDRALRTLFDAMGPLSEVGAVVASLQVLEKVGPLIEDYIKESLRQGLRFEEVFPLKDNLRWLWTLLYGRGEKGAV